MNVEVISNQCDICEQNNCNNKTIRANVTLLSELVLKVNRENYFSFSFIITYFFLFTQ